MSSKSSCLSSKLTKIAAVILSAVCLSAVLNWRVSQTLAVGYRQSRAGEPYDSSGVGNDFWDNYMRMYDSFNTHPLNPHYQPVKRGGTFF